MSRRTSLRRGCMQAATLHDGRRMVKASKPAARAATTRKRTYRSASRAAPEAAGVLVELGRRIREVRLAAKMTQEKTAHAAGITFKHYQTIEGGQIGRASCRERV